MREHHKKENDVIAAVFYSDAARNLLHTMMIRGASDVLGIPVEDWTTEDVCNHLWVTGFAQQALQAREHGVDGVALSAMVPSADAGRSRDRTGKGGGRSAPQKIDAAAAARFERLGFDSAEIERIVGGLGRGLGPEGRLRQGQAQAATLTAHPLALEVPPGGTAPHVTWVPKAKRRSLGGTENAGAENARRASTDLGSVLAQDDGSYSMPRWALRHGRALVLQRLFAGWSGVTARVLCETNDGDGRDQDRDRDRRRATASRE